LFLVSDNRNQDINIYINSPGGSVTAGLAIYDTMQFVQCDIATFCIGQASSMGAVLLAAGTQGKRHALPHSRIMIHQPWGGAQGTAMDIEIQAREIKRNKEVLCEILGRHAGKGPKQIEDDSHWDFFMSAQEAKDYGLVDQVIDTLKPVAEVS
jgi:ATP-dependent Clp protease protease subunit